MKLRAICLALACVACVAGDGEPATAQAFEVTPFVGYETSGSYPVENPTAVEAFRADAAKMYGAFVDYSVAGNVQVELEWAHNPTTYSAQDALAGQYSEAFATSINQYQLGALYYLRDRGNARWMPTYGSEEMSSACDDFGNCYPTTFHHFLQRFDVAIGLVIRP